MKHCLCRLMAAIVALMSLAPLAGAQQAAPPAPASPPMVAAQIDQLVAPIALYPDPLLSQILMAATYPLELVEADRWLQVPANAALKGDQLAAALQNQPWDPSVKSLVPFPDLVHMMDSNLEWTEQLGDAFLTQPADVMDGVQRLRQRAEAARTLASTPQQTVATQDQEIVIEPASPALVYVPVYNPWCVYGPWPYPAYPPFYFGTWLGYCLPADQVLLFGLGIYPFGFWAWSSFEWRHHRIRIDHDRFASFHAGAEPAGGIWQHDPSHRLGVPYRDPATATRFLGPAAAAQRNFRGFGGAPAAVPQARQAAPSIERAPTVVRPAPTPSAVQPAAPPAFESFGRGADVRAESARGLSSRSAPVAPISGGRAAPSVGGGRGGVGGGAGRR